MRKRRLGNDGPLVSAIGLGRGMLTDNTPQPSKFSDNDFRKPSPRFQEPNYSDNVEAIWPFRDLAADMAIPSSALALACCHPASPMVTVIRQRRTTGLSVIAKWCP